MNDFILGPQVPIGDNYFDQTFLAKARQHGAALPDSLPEDFEAVVIRTGSITSTVNNHFYYDLPLVLYIAYQRTGDPTFLAMARKAADLWWQHPQWIGSGKLRPFPDSATPSPREANLGGLILRAMDERREMWDWINAYARAAFDTWIKIRIPKPDAVNPQLHYGLREGAFALQYAAWLSQVLPDSFPLQSGGTVTNGAELRAQYLADIETACVQYFGRLQYPDGSWRWNTAPDEFKDSDGGTLQGIMQPFMVGLMTSALVDAHQVVQSLAVRENIKSQILRACRHLYSDGPYVKDEIEQNSGVRIRGFHYFYHGGTSVNPTRYEKGNMTFPWTAIEAWWLPSARQAISTILPAFGYAYKLSGDEFYKTAGDELWDAAYSGRDGIRAMMDDTAKNFNQHARRGGSYRAWLGGTIVEPPPPPPPPPDPILPPSPDGTKAVEVIDSNSGRWWLAADGKTMRNQTHMGGGAGKIYKWLGGVVYVLGINDLWYKWAGTAWEKVGSEPGVTPPVEPPPVEPPPVEPPPTPKPCSINAPPSIDIPRNGFRDISVQLEGLMEPTTVTVSSGSDGQVSVLPASKVAQPASAILSFRVRVKNKKMSRTITFQSGCGSVNMKVNVI